MEIHLRSVTKKICCANSSEKVIRYDDYHLASWYKNNFLQWGFQKIKSPSGKREVFFVQAIAL